MHMCMHAHICADNDAKDVEWYVAVYLGNLFTSCVFAEACQVVSCKAMSIKLVSGTF